ncbi:MAG: hypothetical protein KF770_28585 [Anaerolineae bacterium]|nr:hypothetical protein [Anaerolineae bacterium]
MNKCNPRHGGQNRLGLGTAPLIHAPVVVVDKQEQSIVALQLLGASQAVNANWAALMGGGKSHYILNEYVQLKGTKKHIKLQKMLPETGWKEMWLLHKQASHNELDAGEEFFYLLDNQESEIPASFIPMLDKAIPIPLQEAWADYLFQEGLDTEVIQPLPNLACVGWGCYKVFKQGWENVISVGIAQGWIRF